MVTIGEKEKLLTHFNYEVRMILKDLPHIDKINGGTIDWILIDALTHLRILFEFFHGNENEERYGHAKHYIDNWNKTPPQEIGIWYGRINEFLSHLSYARTRKDWIKWPIHELIYPHYKKLIIKFLTEIPIDYKNSDLDKLLEDVKKS